MVSSGLFPLLHSIVLGQMTRPCPREPAAWQESQSEPPQLWRAPAPRRRDDASTLQCTDVWTFTMPCCGLCLPGWGGLSCSHVVGFTEEPELQRDHVFFCLDPDSARPTCSLASPPTAPHTSPALRRLTSWPRGVLSRKRGPGGPEGGEARSGSVSAAQRCPGARMTQSSRGGRVVACLVVEAGPQGGNLASDLLTLRSSWTHRL